MTGNHRNRSWRSQWVLDPTTRSAVHKSGVTVRVFEEPADRTKDRLAIENATQLEKGKWDIETIAEQAKKLWLGGLF